jgi:hypothetical protein
LSTPSAKLRNSAATPDDGDKLLDLYKNRAALKKEFARLREEKYQLQERIKEQQGTTARLQQKFEHLESLLQDPEWAHTVTVVYQLRALNSKCQRKLEAFAEELKQQREHRQHGQTVEQWSEEQSRRAATIESQLGEHRAHVQTLEDQLHTEQNQSGSSGVLSGIFGRSKSSSRDKLVASITAAKEKEQQLLQELEKIQSRQAPDQPGLDVATKRSINFMILSFAQQLWLHYSTDDLAALAKEANDRSPGAFKYGTREECESLLERIRMRAESLEQLTTVADVLQRRSKLIAESAMFHNDDDTVPDTGTVATVYAIDADGIVKKTDSNLLGQNYWDLANILSR